jgi:Tol biopolymer transport system component
VIKDLESGADPTGRITEDWSYDPAWSPDGTKLAFIQGNDDVGYNIYAIEISSGEIVTVTSGTGYVRDSPSWSPDGERLAFREMPLEHLGLLPWQTLSSIRIVNADGSGLTDLVAVYPVPHLPFNEYHAQSPSWSPDGNHVMFSALTTVVSGGQGVFVYHIFRLRLDLSEVKDLTPMDLGRVGGPSLTYLTPAWSPEGTRFAYVLVQSHPDFHTSDVVVADSNTGETVSSLTWMMSARDPVWSPDGEYVAFCMEGAIHVIRADASPEEEPLFIDEGYSPNWTR